jgi:hypothetical protein
MKPLIIMRFPKDAPPEELHLVRNYLNTHSASEDYHFLIISDGEYDGPIEFKYFNETTSL